MLQSGTFMLIDTLQSMIVFAKTYLCAVSRSDGHDASCSSISSQFPADSSSTYRPHTLNPKPIAPSSRAIRDRFFHHHLSKTAQVPNPHRETPGLRVADGFLGGQNVSSRSFRP